MRKYLTFLLGYLIFYSCYSMATQFSLRLDDAPLKTSLHQIAATLDINLIMDDSVTGNISLKMQEITFEQLMQSIAKIKQLSFTREGNIYYLAKNPINSKPILKTNAIKLQYAKAEDIMKSLNSSSGNMLSDQGSLTFDLATNQILVQDNTASVANVRALIKALDKPSKQVVIEARIVNISTESLQELGVRWGILEGTSRVGAKLWDGSGNLENQLSINFPVNGNSASIAFNVAKIQANFLDLELNALERENNIEIIASPKLLTTNRKSANIKQGTEIPYTIMNKNNNESIEFREAVLGLDVTPHINPDGSVLLDLFISQNTPGNKIKSGSTEVTTINKQEINTQVFAQNGETIVLGGIFQQNTINGVSKVPILGDIPVIKHLFGSETAQYHKRELVIFVTPRIVTSDQ